jgi:hypothetical protein
MDEIGDWATLAGIILLGVTVLVMVGGIIYAITHWDEN